MAAMPDADVVPTQALGELAIQFRKGDGAASKYVAHTPHFRHFASRVIDRRTKRDPGRARKRTPNFRRLKNPGLIYGSILQEKPATLLLACAFLLHIFNGVKKYF